MTDQYSVIKRNGDKVPFNVMKIKKVIEWATDDLQVNPLVLESQIHINVQNNMTTEQIQDIVISTAISLTKIEDTFIDLEWRIVAARLRMLNIYKKAKKTQGHDSFGYDSYYKFVLKAVEEGIYDRKIIDEYSKEELEEMERERNPKYDRDYDYAATNLMIKRYLMKLDGNIFELPQDMYLTLALFLALPEKKENRIKIAKKIYHAIAGRKISLATPIVLNLRRPNGNLASCFVTAMDDSLDSIYYTLDQLAQISKNAGGVGVNVSRIRSHGARIKGVKGASSGVLPWIKLINDTAIAVNQLGSRAGAITVALDIWHADIEDFLTMQHENGDQRKKAYDIFPQIVISDLFMKRAEADLKWTLVDPHEVRVKYGVELAELYGEKFEEIYLKIEQEEKLEFKKVIDAKSLMKVILKTVVETGLPYVFFKDSVNNANPNKHCGMIGNANLCTESFSNFKPSKIRAKQLSADRKEINQSIISGEVHTCNLVSLNWAMINDDETLEAMTRLSVRILDNTIDISTPPIPEAEKHNSEYRILGIGSLGLADWIANRGVSYKDAGDLVDGYFEKVAYFGIDESVNLAVDRGTYKNYEGSDWSKGIFFGRELNWYEENSSLKNKWRELAGRIEKNGIRNGGIFAIAPNTSTSLLMGSSAGVIPIYKKFFIEKASHGSTPICPPFLNNKTFWVYQEAQNIDQQDVIEIVSRIQKWTDQGISMELVLNFQRNIKAKDIYELYLNAWKKKCKAVYYVRSITQTAESKKEECVSCAN